MNKKTKWETGTLLNIRRDFSEKEKYKILMDDYCEMTKKLENYKNEVIKLKEKHVALKQQHIELQSKYTKLLNHGVQ